MRESVTAEPVTAEPVAVEPVAVEPAATEPVTTEPATAEPVTVEPVTTEPVATEPVTAVLPPAPGAEQYPALDFANSAIALPGGQFLDLLGTPATATRWLVEHDLAPAGAGLQEMCAAQLRSLREQVRALLASHVAQAPAPPGALSALNDALTRAPSAALLCWDPTRGLHRATAHPVTQIVDRALAVLAANAADLLTGSDAGCIAACGATPCNRYLLRTHARRHWCSTRCGDRVRAARAYARRTRSTKD